MDPLETPKSRIARASRHLDELRAEWQAFEALEPATAHPVPSVLRPIIFDVAVHLRGALDDVACALAVANGKSTGGVYFPVAGSVGEFWGPAMQGKTRKLAPDARAFINTLEPCKGGKGELYWLLAQLRNPNERIELYSSADAGIHAVFREPRSLEGKYVFETLVKMRDLVAETVAVTERRFFSLSLARKSHMQAKTMNAIEITRAGGPEVLVPTTRPMPEPREGEVLIKVAYGGINRHDCGQRARGFGPKGATDIPGLEVSGEVAAVGQGVTRWKAGDKVCALVNGGGYAEYCIALEPVVFPIPADFDMKLAAGLPEALMTAWFNVLMLGRLKPREWLLVHGGSSGVGSIAIQLARLEGAKVVTTVGNGEKAGFCRKLGAHKVINYRDEDFVAAVKDATQGAGADVILDMVGVSYARRNLDALAMDGRVVHLSGGGTAEFCVPLSGIMQKRAIITGSQLRVSSLDTKKEIVRQLNERVWPHLGTQVKPFIDSVLPLAQAADAHARMESSVHIGKILLEV